MNGRPDLHLKKLEEILNTTDDSDTGYFIEVDLKTPDDIKEKTKNIPFCPEQRVIPEDKYNGYLKKTKPKSFTKAKKLLCD